MNDDWSTPTAEHQPMLVLAAADALPEDEQPDFAPVPIIAEGDLRILESYYAELALDAAKDPTPPGPEEQAEVDQIMEHLRWLKSATPDEVARVRRHGRRY
jgi:hypothetical protein